MTKKLLLIGWDAADWKTIDRLVDQGDMPILKGLIERGIHGALAKRRSVP
jgi:predicted AlkP superfamily phosphohydrolase/phosphomutase